MTPDNADRSSWAATAIDAFTSVCRMDGEDNQTKAKDLATNLVHYLRLECGLSLEEASTVIINAVNMAEQETEEDGDGDGDEGDEPVLRTYGVRLWGTFRACAEDTIEAHSYDEAIAKAQAINLDDYTFKIEQMDGDQSITVYGPSDDDPADDAEWEGDGAEVDMREPGEPFSWAACDLVKDLAKLDPVVTLNDDAAAAVTVSKEQLGEIAALITRARSLCTKED